jgi:hypothetical protein
MSKGVHSLEIILDPLKPVLNSLLPSENVTKNFIVECDRVIPNLAESIDGVVVRRTTGSVNQINIILMVNSSGLKTERPRPSG